MNLQSILPFLGSLVVAGLAYIIQKRRQSGQIQTSEAADLWAESKSIRDFQAKEMTDLRTELDTLKKRFAIVEQEALDCLKREQARSGGRLKAKRGDV